MPADDIQISQWLGGKAAPVGVAQIDAAGVDAFGKVRTSEPADIFDSQLEYDLAPLVWDTFVTGSASVVHSYAQAAAVLSVSGSASVALRQPRGYIRYQPGKSQLINLTYEHQPSFDTLFRVGYYDDGDGFFLEHSGTAVSLVLRSSVSGVLVEQRIPQSEWNSDRFNGDANERYNPSGESLDHSLAQHLVIDTQWLGVGRARMGFYLNGQIHYGHKFQGSNAGHGPFMRTANLPVRYELRGLPGIVQARTALQICSAVHSEGGVSEERGTPFAASRGVSAIAVSARRPILTLRPAATFNGHVNRELIIPTSVILETEDDAIYWELLHGAVVSGTVAFAPVDAYSGVEYDISGSLVFGGHRVADGYIAIPGGGVAGETQADVITGRMRIALGIQGEHPTVEPTDNLVLVVTNLGAGSTATRASINGTELR